MSDPGEHMERFSEAMAEGGIEAAVGELDADLKAEPTFAPHLIKVLSLPAGFTVTREDRAVIRVCDGAGEERWSDE